MNFVPLDEVANVQLQLCHARYSVFKMYRVKRILRIPRVSGFNRGCPCP